MSSVVRSHIIVGLILAILFGGCWKRIDKSAYEKGGNPPSEQSYEQPHEEGHEESGEKAAERYRPKPDNQASASDNQLAPSNTSVEGREIAQRAFRSTVFVSTRSNDGLGQGSGFVVKQNVVATNYHVIEGAQDIVVSPLGGNQKYPVDAILSTDPEQDLALLRVGGLPLPSLTLSRGDDLAVGDAVYVIGNPRGMAGTFSDGIVSAFRETGNNAFIQLTAPVSPGSSGGPVLDRQARVVGVIMGAIEEGQNLNFAIPAADLQRLIQASMAKNFQR